MGRRYVPGSKHFKATEQSKRERLASLGISEGTCEGCYQSPCVCLPDGADCDPDDDYASTPHPSAYHESSD